MAAKRQKQKWDGGPLRDAWLDHQKTHGTLSKAKVARLASEWLGRPVAQQTVNEVLNAKSEPGFAFGCAICAALGLDPLKYARPWKGEVAAFTPKRAVAEKKDSRAKRDRKDA